MPLQSFLCPPRGHFWAPFLGSMCGPSILLVSREGPRARPSRGQPAGTFLRRCPRPRDRDFPRFPARDPWALCKNRVRNSGPGGTFCNVHTAGTFAKNAESVPGLNREIMGPNPGTAGTFGECGFWEVPAPPRLGARHGHRGHILKGAHGSVARISHVLFSRKSPDRATAGTFRRFGQK